MTTCPVAEVLPASTDEDLDSVNLRYREKCGCVGKERMQRLPGKYPSDVRGLDWHKNILYTCFRKIQLEVITAAI